MALQYAAIEAGLNNLLGRISLLSESDRAEVFQFINVGEHGLAIETLFDICVDNSYPLDRTWIEQIYELAIKMGLSDSVDITKLTPADGIGALARSPTEQD